MTEPRDEPAHASSARESQSTDSNFNAARESSPEPSLAARMARADMKDAFEAGDPPFNGNSQPDPGVDRTGGTGAAERESPSALDLGGRVNARRATYGRSGRVGLAAAGGPVQSVGAGMMVPHTPSAAGVSPVPDPDTTSDEADPHDQGLDVTE